MNYKCRFFGVACQASVGLRSIMNDGELTAAGETCDQRRLDRRANHPDLFGVVGRLTMYRDDKIHVSEDRAFEERELVISAAF
jgi:hypothetical protein